ncbi:MAG: restriction endonuclease subunit S [Candidatus Korobacteraceae bacterium]|jgi:type I restriction enzyme S subunit
MNPELLLTHFDRISDTSDAIPRLRRFVLDLAVRGKLVEQDPNDEPASALLKRVQQKKAEIAKEAGARKERPLPHLAENELLFCIPTSWRWSQLAEIGFISPRNIAGDGIQSSFVPMPLISPEYGVPNTHEVRPWCEIKSGFTHFAEGDVALAKITPCFENGKSTIFRGLTGGIGAGTTELHVVRPVIVSADYVLIFLKCPHFIESGISRMTGTAGQKRVPTEYFAYSPFPLPPLAEQNRIVAKVEELMALFDRLEAARGERDRCRDRLSAASHYHVNNGENAEAAREHASFYVNHLPTITTRSEQIPALREAILNLTVRGRIILQDENDEPVSTLLKRIHAEQLRLINDGVIPKPKPPHSDTRAELAFDLPKSWETVTFGRLCNIVTSGSRGWAEYYSESGPKFIRAQNIRFGRLRLDDLACVNPPKRSEGTRTQVSKGDLLVVITGAGVTNPALMDEDLGEAYVSQHVALIKPTDTNLSPWLLLCLMAPMGGRAELVMRAYGAGKPGLNLDNIRSLPIPLPPLAEQRRIVARVVELMSLCDRLEEQLSDARNDSRRLLEAVLHHALTDGLQGA